MRQLQFWFEFTSTYSFLSAMRIEELAKRRGVEVEWKPFLLGPIFDARGWDTSPFEIYADKGTYMWRDVERRANEHGLVFRRPAEFPQHSLKAARVAQMALQTVHGTEFVRAVYSAMFSKGETISDDSVIIACLDRAGLPAKLLDAANDHDNKSALKSVVDDAQGRGIFGAPSFTVKEELFWGDDRLETALDWACRPE